MFDWSVVVMGVLLRHLSPSCIERLLPVCIFKVQGSRFKVQGSRFKVQGSRFKVQKVQGSRFKVQIRV
jgi:hypothetical protein